MTPDLVEEIVAALDSGERRVAEKVGDEWVVDVEAKEAILEYFRLRKVEPMEVGPFSFQDKIPLKRHAPGVRIVPPGVARYGSFLSEGMRGYLESLPPERGVDPGSLTDAMRVIDEDFGHPAFLPRAGDPGEIGPLVAFLVSPLNSYMTGANINVDGGSDF